MHYLEKVQRDTPTRFWVNNPTLAEAKESIDQGAFACTTNPAYCSKLLQNDPDYIRAIIRSVKEQESAVAHPAEAVYHAASARLMELFAPVYEASGGEKGFVTIQEDPRLEENTAYIVEASLRAAKLGKNYMAKIPVTEAGLKVIASMVEHNIAICATEIFSLAQAEKALAVYEEAARRFGRRPAFYVTHITGIMDDYFQDLVKKEKIKISAEALAWAGTAIAYKEYAFLKAQACPCVLLGGGARHSGHFSNFVGADMHITINWSTGLQLNEMFSEPQLAELTVPQNYIDELIERLPNFARAYNERGMDVAEFADYGPVMLFRTQFMNGYARLIDEIALLA